MRWIDHHCHLPSDADAAAALVEEASVAEVARLVDVGTDVASSQAARLRAHTYGAVWATAGVHPHDATDVTAPDGTVDLSAIEALLDDERVVAVGECGLDYYYEHSPRDAQQAAFRAQLAVADARDLPVVIHTRDAWDDTFAILDEVRPRRAVLHCFTGGPDEATRALELGLWLSFSGIATFGSAGDVRAAARLCPLDRVLVETDSPYLAPEGHRGRKNRPALVTAVGASVADTMGVPVDELAAATWANATTFYRLPDEG